MRTAPTLLAIALLGASSPAAERPNVLLLLVDDLKPALGCYGDPHAKTPHIDALAARGMRFDLAYCNQAVCAPSRFTLMLGSHSTSTGLYGLGSNLRQTLPGAVTLPQHFAKHGGYRTESLGKIFHIGHGNHGDPASFSVPHFKEKVIEYVDPASKPDGAITREEAMFQNRAAPPGGMNALPRGAAFESPDVGDDAYADGRVAAETVRRLRAARARRTEDGTPFFIAAGFARPHLPFSAPKRYWDLHDPAKLPLAENRDLPASSPGVAHKRGGEIRNYSPVPDKDQPEVEIDDALARQLVHGYYASTSYADAQIGKVLGALDELGLAGETIVVLWGDHGFHLGDLGIWTKHTNYEQANRIPIIIAAPGVTEPGSSTKQLAESVDLFPTLAELAGLPAPAGPQPVDGLSLVPVLEDPDARVRDHAYHAYPKGELGRAIRTERYRLVEWGDEYELYDYQADPLETENHANDRPEVVAELKGILDSYPPPVGRDGRRTRAAIETPEIAGREIEITATVRADSPQGVVLAQGGREQGYALHFIDGVAALDVRIDGEVTRLQAGAKSSGTIRLAAHITTTELRLKVDGARVTGKSPGLIATQPKDPLSVGRDELSAAGDYPEGGNAFTGRVIGHRVIATRPPPAGAGAGEVPTKQGKLVIPAAQVAPVAPVMGRAEIEAGLRSHDRALFIKNDWIRDPYITLGPDDRFYLTGTTIDEDDPREESDPYNIGLADISAVGATVRVWRSEDLIDWEYLGTPYTLADSHHPDPGDRVWAPELHWIAEMGRWALVHCPRQKSVFALSAGPELRGPWSHPLGDNHLPKHDPSLYRDGETWWMLSENTRIQPLAPDFSRFTSTPTRIDPAGTRPDPDGGKPISRIGHEGATMIRVGGNFVHFGTAWSTDRGRKGSYNLYYCSADTITGPYGPRRFAGRFLGHGTPFQTRDGNWWCTAFFNADVPPLPREGIRERDLSETAQTINGRGTTIVPLDVRVLDDGEVSIRAKDPDYAHPGPDEAQKF